jgi:anti-sigma-K factor RskA
VVKTPYRPAGHDDLHVLTGSYALDALAGPERDAFERHLQHCASCDAEVRGLREAAARLAVARAVEPPDRMRHRVLAATYRTRQLPPPLDDQLSRRTWLVRLVLPSGRRTAPARHRHVPRAIAAGVAACAAAAIAFGVVSHVTAPPRPPAAISSVLGARDAQTETMRTAGGGTVTVTVSWDQREAVVSTAGLSSLPSARVYQLWVMSPAGTSPVQARPAGLLRSGPVLASAIRPGDRIGITVEPAGGTAQPTTQPVVTMTLPA